MPDPGLDTGDAESEEHQRIRRVYAGYEIEHRYRTIWADTEASRYMRERKWQTIFGALEAHHVSLEDAWCLDLGSDATGDGARLRHHAQTVRGIVAIDLIHQRLAEARHVNSTLLALAADASRLPLLDASIGAVYQSTMLSSVLDPGLRARILAEVRRVLKAGGVFISYDTRYPNPWNRHTRPVLAGEMKRAFAGWPQTASSLTGIPQIVRLLAPISTTACRLVEALPVLRSHMLFVACRPPLSC